MEDLSLSLFGVRITPEGLDNIVELSSEILCSVFPDAQVYRGLRRREKIHVSAFVCPASSEVSIRVTSWRFFPSFVRDFKFCVRVTVQPFRRYE